MTCIASETIFLFHVKYLLFLNVGTTTCQKKLQLKAGKKGGRKEKKLEEYVATN